MGDIETVLMGDTPEIPDPEGRGMVEPRLYADVSAQQLARDLGEAMLGTGPLSRAIQNTIADELHIRLSDYVQRNHISQAEHEQMAERLMDKVEAHRDLFAKEIYAPEDTPQIAIQDHDDSASPQGWLGSEAWQKRQPVEDFVTTANAEYEHVESPKPYLISGRPFDESLARSPDRAGKQRRWKKLINEAKSAYKSIEITPVIEPDEPAMPEDTDEPEQSTSEQLKDGEVTQIIEHDEQALVDPIEPEPVALDTANESDMVTTTSEAEDVEPVAEIADARARRDEKQKKPRMRFELQFGENDDGSRRAIRLRRVPLSEDAKNRAIDSVRKLIAKPGQMLKQRKADKIKAAPVTPTTPIEKSRRKREEATTEPKQTKQTDDKAESPKINRMKKTRHEELDGASDLMKFGASILALALVAGGLRAGKNMANRNDVQRERAAAERQKTVHDYIAWQVKETQRLSDEHPAMSYDQIIQLAQQEWKKYSEQQQA